jgi:hypothetical protein
LAILPQRRERKEEILIWDWGWALRRTIMTNAMVNTEPGEESKRGVVKELDGSKPFSSGARQRVPVEVHEV